MSVRLNTRCQMVAGAYIAAGDVELEAPWAPAALELEALLADEPGRYYLGMETNLPADEPTRWRYPVGLLDGDAFQVWKSALETIVALAADDPSVQQAAETLLGKIDAGDGEAGAGTAGDGDGDSPSGGETDDDPKPPEAEDIPADDVEPPAGGGGPGKSTIDLEVRAMRLTDQPLTPERFGLSPEALRGLPAEERDRRAALIQALDAGDEATIAACRAQLRELKSITGEDLQRTFGTNAFNQTAQVRATTLDRESRTVDLSFSSELPYSRWWGEEILGHKKAEVRLERLNAGGALLLNHWVDDHVGVIEKAWIDTGAKMGRSLVRFSKSAKGEEVMTDVEDRIRRSTSVGYLIHAMKLIETKTVGDFEVDVYRVTDWEPLEVSLVSVPADPTVGVGRNMPTGTAPAVVTKQEVIPMSVAAIPGTAAPEQDTSALTGAAIQAERERAKNIRKLGGALGQAELAEKAVNDGMELEAFRAQLLDVVASKPPVRQEAGPIGLSDHEVKSYSLMRAIRALAAAKGVADFRRADIDAAGLEFEASTAIAKRYGLSPQGMFVPIEVMRAPMRQLAQRDLQVGLDTAGGYLVDTTMLGMIDLLRAKSLVLRMGATALGGLVGDVAIPKETGANTAYWLNEGGEPSESQPALGQLALVPHTVGAYTDLTRRFMKQVSLDAEAWVRGAIAKSLGQEADRVAINGSGVDGQPVGILQVTGIGPVIGAGGNGTAPTWADVIACWREVAVDNADVGTLGFLTNVLVAAKLMTTPKEAGQATYIMDGFDAEGFGKLMGAIRTGISNNVPSNLAYGSGTSLSALLFGNWADLVIASWGVLDLTVDLSVLSKSGGMRVIGLQDIDIALRRQQSFSAKKDCITT